MHPAEDDAGFPSCLLQLPGPAFSLVLQKLNTCSLVCKAATCSKLRLAVPAHTSSLDITLRSQHSAQLQAFASWLQQQRNSLTNLTALSISNAGMLTNHLTEPLGNLPLPQLRSLRLYKLPVQFGVCGGPPGVLWFCRGLTALDLDSCSVQYENGARTAFAAIAARSDLCSLRLQLQNASCSTPLLEQLQQPTRLTHLALTVCEYDLGCRYCPANIPAGQGKQLHQQLSQQLSLLSSSVNLQHLELTAVPAGAVLGGRNFPSQLVQLTCLHVQLFDPNVAAVPGPAGVMQQYTYHLETFDPAEQFQHLGSLTALKVLNISGTWDRDQPQPNVNYNLTGIQCLTQLTELKLAKMLLHSIGSTCSWTGLTALHSLLLSSCELQPHFLAALTHLQQLLLECSNAEGPDTWEALMSAVSQLQLLTALQFSYQPPNDAPCPTVGSFSALTANSSLCSLRVAISGRSRVNSRENFPRGCVLITPGSQLQSMRHIDLQNFLPMSLEQVKQLCSRCPGLTDLRLPVLLDRPATAAERFGFEPLLQLSALTRLELYNLEALEAAAAAVDVAAQLTQLRELVLKPLPRVSDRSLLQLTALTALEMLHLPAPRPPPRALPPMLFFRPPPAIPPVMYANKARHGSPSDVWIQLLRDL